MGGVHSVKLRTYVYHYISDKNVSFISALDLESLGHKDVAWPSAKNVIPHVVCARLFAKNVIIRGVVVGLFVVLKTAGNARSNDLRQLWHSGETKTRYFLGEVVLDIQLDASESGVFISSMQHTMSEDVRYAQVEVRPICATCEALRGQVKQLERFIGYLEKHITELEKKYETDVAAMERRHEADVQVMAHILTQEKKCATEPEKKVDESPVLEAAKSHVQGYFTEPKKSAVMM